MACITEREMTLAIRLKSSTRAGPQDPKRQASEPFADGPRRGDDIPQIGVVGVCMLLSMCVCVCFLPIHSGHQVRWTYQPGSHRRKVTQDFSSTFFLRCMP